MSVHFPQGDGRTVRIGTNGGVPGRCTLFGEPFPPDDVKAYWSLVPTSIIVEWSSEFGVFFVTRNRPVDEDDQPTVRQQIMASDAHKLEVWMRVISGLINGEPR